MSEIQRVLVVGGGIAGLTAANALARRGVAVDVVELHDRPTGAAITLLNRAVDGIEEIGLLDRFLEEGVPRSPQDLFRYLDAAGEPVPTPPMPARPPSRLPLGVVIYRPTMSALLRDGAEKAGAHVRAGIGIAALDQDDDGVSATLTDGSQARYDLVVGADGVRSRTRDLVFGDAVSPRYSGTTMFRYVVDGIPDLGPEGFYQSAQYLVVTLRLRDGRVYVAAGRNYAEPPVIDRAGARRALRENLDTFTAPLLRAVRDRITDDSRILVNDYDWLMQPGDWHRGRVLLIGDAAHATTAHLASGGGMAIEDGVVLGHEVAAGGTAAEVLARFSRRRAERARLVVETSVEIGRLEQTGASVQAQNELRGRAMGVLSSPY